MAQMIHDMASQEGANEHLKKLAEDLEKNPPEDTNGGHDALMMDLTLLLKDASEFQFHDYKNEKYPAPKAALMHRSEEIIQNMKNGKYDN